MTRGSVKEYVEAIRERYRRAGRKEKKEILDQFTVVTGYHRKAAIRLLGRQGSRQGGRRRGRPRTYGEEVTAILKVVWEATDRLCSKRLQPFLPELVRILQEQDELKVTSEMTKQMCQLSASTANTIPETSRRPC